MQFSNKEHNTPRSAGCQGGCDDLALAMGGPDVTEFQVTVEAFPGRVPVVRAWYLNTATARLELLAKQTHRIARLMTAIPC